MVNSNTHGTRLEQRMCVKPPAFILTSSLTHRLTNIRRLFLGIGDPPLSGVPPNKRRKGTPGLLGVKLDSRTAQDGVREIEKKLNEQGGISKGNETGLIIWWKTPPFYFKCSNIDKLKKK